MIEFAASARVYVDTNIWIYFIEAAPGFSQQVIQIFARVEDAGARLVTNELAIAECIYKPSRDRQQKTLDVYESLFACGEIDISPLDGGLARRAAQAGGELGLKLFDSIHYLSALEEGCDFFLTSDHRFQSGPSMEIIRLEA